ncbi:MAG TPA: hypothetical protein VF487_17545 [Chitinophagaceae bacterium]
MKKILIILFTLPFIQNIHAQQANIKPCAVNPVNRFFDFWIGEWEAYGPKGKGGDSKISLVLDSCVILEEWTSTQQGYAGKSFNTYNTATKMWQQTWVDNKGGLTEYSNSRWNKDTMIVTTDNQKQANGSWLIQRMTFIKLSNDKVRQHGENSTDGGKTWATSFDLEYRRKK